MLITVFTDFDGVLNGNNKLIERCRNNRDEIDLPITNYEGLDKFWASEMVWDNTRLFMEAIKGYDVQIVLSTSWRDMKSLEEWNNQFRKIDGWNVPIIDKTPMVNIGEVVEVVGGYKSTDPRGNEIKAWLEQNNYTGNYVIIDDDSDMLLEQKDNFLQTNCEIGFSENDKVKLIKMLEEFKNEN